ncbi:aconitase family protein [Amylibacter sp.]|nr:aconitase family protein [Amylibacter sp.]MDB2523983.1 aconitase family protein [Amylibacter sp.]
MENISNNDAIIYVQNDVDSDIVICDEGLSFWGGVDPNTGVIIDTHHSNCGEKLSGKIVLMPTSRGSCSGSGVLLQLAQNGNAPAALIFRETEDVLTLGAMIAERLFDKNIAVLRLVPKIYNLLSEEKSAKIDNLKLHFSNTIINLFQPAKDEIHLSNSDKKMLAGDNGEATKIAMEVLCLMAAAQNADKLIDVSRGHIDGCILAHDANLHFAEKMLDMGASVIIPTTINAISVDRENWKSQGVAPDLGGKASRLADAYVKMGAYPTFTCAPYLLDEKPSKGEVIGWSESNAVIYANSVIGARTQKHPDYLDLFIAMTGRTPNTGVYLEENRKPVCEIQVVLPSNFDDAIWPMIGWLAGHKSPNGIPVLNGLEDILISNDDLKALCAAFGTTSAAPMIHIKGHTPESELQSAKDAKYTTIMPNDLLNLWQNFNNGNNKIDLVAIGSPHASTSECLKFLELLEENNERVTVPTILTIGRETLSNLNHQGSLNKLSKLGVQVIPDICWCSITEPVFPPEAKSLLTNSGKYAHYGEGLTGRNVRFGSLSDCALAAMTGYVDNEFPDWLKT